jgi:hypothetical protein
MLIEKQASDEVAVTRRDGSALIRGKWTYLLMGSLIIYVVVRSIVAAATKPFWFDELLTLTVSSLPSMKAVWTALAHALDGQPPGFYFVERNFVTAVHSKEIALRLASIITFPVTLVCVFIYAKKRSGETIALLCAFLLLLTSLFTRYAVEARPYSMMIACFAFALVCYQRVPNPLWTVLFAVTLAIAQTLHHYSVLSMVPFGIAETVFLARAKKFRWQVWLALVVGAVPLLFFWPLLAQLKAAVGVHYYERYSYSAVPGTYGAFFLTDSAFATAVVAVAVAGIIGSRFLRRTETPSKISDLDAAEGTLLLSLTLLPLIAFTIVNVMHGGMRDAYILASLLGIALALAGALSIARPGVVAMFAVFVFFSVAVREYKFWRSDHSLHFRSPAADVQEFVEKNGNPKLPVVISSGMRYTPLNCYASPAFAKRMFYLMDKDKLYKYEGTDTFDKTVEILGNYMPLQVRDFSEFTAEHPEFLLYTEEPDDGGTWLPIYLSREAESMRTVVVEPSRRLYLVRMKGAPHG